MSYSVAPHDLSRAFAFATAINQRCVTPGRIDSFMSAGDFAKYVNGFMTNVEPQYRIQKVHLSSESEKQQFVMAIAEDAVFIGFRGTKDFADIACDLQVCKTTEGQIGGASYHRGIHVRSEAFLGLLGSNLLNSLLRIVLGTTGNSRKRIVFCGHSLGGAVAHLVLMRLLLENPRHRNDMKDANKHSPGNMISIAFGAPHLCDEIAAALINDIPSFKCRFTTFVNRRDPVPRLLHHLPSSVANALDATIKLIGTTIGALGGFAGDGPRGENLAGEAMPDSDAAGSSNVTDRSESLYKEEVTDLKKYAAKSQGEYHPIGFYIFLCGGSPRLRRVASATVELSRLLSDVQLGEECVGEHRGTSYRSALLEAELIHDEDLGQEPPPPSFLPTALEPDVHSATGKQSDSAESFTVTVTGKNLQFLREVQWRRLGTVQQIEATHFGIAEDDELMFWCRCTPCEMEELTKRAREKELKNKELRIGKLVVRTAFGCIESHIIAEFRSGVNVDNATPRLLPRLSQAVMVMRNLQAEIFSTVDARNRLNDILKCAPLNNGRPTFQELFNQPTTSLEASKQLKKMESNLLDFLHEGFKVRYKTTKLPEDAMRRFVRAAALVAAFSTVSIATPCLILLTYKAGKTGFKILDQIYVDNWQYDFDSYESFVAFAVDEVGTWPSNVQVKVSEDRQSIATLENDLVNRVNAVSGNFFKDMVDEACGTGTDSGNGAVTCAWPHHFPRLTSKLKGAEDETKRNFFRKTKVIVETKKLYKEVVAGTCFVALMGEEDAGKSTFIKKAILAENDENPSRLETPEPSASEHTKQPRPYKGKDELWLVDFPGTNGTEDYAVYWNQYTALPSFIVFLFDYNGDVKSNQVEIYKRLKQKTSTPIMVAFNRVDQRFDRNSRPELLQQGFFARLKANAAEKLGCDEKDVFYVALEPGHPDEFSELQGAGVLGFDDFMNEVRRRVRDST